VAAGKNSREGGLFRCSLFFVALNGAEVDSGHAQKIMPGKISAILSGSQKLSLVLKSFS
jgi:hypothetical protein